jgi:ribonuclease T1
MKLVSGAGRTRGHRPPLQKYVVWILLFCTFVLSTAPLLQAQRRQPNIATVSAADLPKEARQTIALIKKGGPYPYKKDGVTFGNFEKLLPLHERGYYREFTVPTPSSRDRGARRIISGRAGELYYTDNHYQSFRRVLE